MTGFRTPHEEWMTEEIQKQKARDAAEADRIVDEPVILVEETPEFAVTGEFKVPPVDPEEVEFSVPSLKITPEAHRAVGLEEARQAFSRGLVLVDLGREWLNSIGYRDETRSQASGAAEAVAQVINLIEAGEGGR